MEDDETSGSQRSASTADGLAGIFGAVRTDRLILRRPTAGDGPAMFRVDGDPETHRYNPAGPAPDQAASDERLRAWLLQWQDDGYGYWAVSLAPEAEVVGFGGVRRMEWRGREVLNLYYRLTPSAWGQGYASELARTAARLAQTHLPHLPVIARTRPANVASARTAERAGLLRRPDLDTAEHLIFALGWPPPA